MLNFALVVLGNDSAFGPVFKSVGLNHFISITKKLNDPCNIINNGVEEISHVLLAQTTGIILLIINAFLQENLHISLLDLTS